MRSVLGGDGNRGRGFFRRDRGGGVGCGRAGGGDLGSPAGPARAESTGAVTLWKGRFGPEAPAEELLDYTVSLPFDRRLADDDVTGSRAHVIGLVAAGIPREDIVLGFNSAKVRQLTGFAMG